MKYLVALLFSALVSEAAKIGTYLDADCSTPITSFFAFEDVCTWGADKYSGAFSISVPKCSNTSLEVNIYNATLAPTCKEAKPILTFSANSSCLPVQDFYVRAEDNGCNSENSAFNVLAHFTENCTDGGLPFTLFTGGSACEENSFAPYILSYDTSTAYVSPNYILTLYESSNGTCRNTLTKFRTESFPAMCLKPTIPYHEMGIDIYNSFPMEPKL